jgi:hypothetical protein
MLRDSDSGNNPLQCGQYDVLLRHVYVTICLNIVDVEVTPNGKRNLVVARHALVPNDQT